MNNKTEALSRVKIDALLKDAGWNLTDGSSVLFELSLPDGTQADYVLCDRQGRPMATLEAKRSRINPITAQDQGRHYAEQLNVPFVFLSNGEEVRFLDRDTDAHSRQIAGFFAQDDLERRSAARQVSRDLSKVAIDQKIVNRDYQLECIEALSAEVSLGRRKLLVEMATGTGKTIVFAVTKRHAETFAEMFDQERSPSDSPANLGTLLTLDVNDHIDPASRDWLTLDENGRIVRMPEHESRAAEVGVRIEEWRSEHEEFDAEQSRWASLIGNRVKADALHMMDGARLVIDEPTVLTQVVSQLNDLHLDRVDADTKGDLFEHVLRQIRQAGELGQFRTPRHIIRALVELVDPHIGETIYDPAAGTAGFLVGTWDHIRLANSSPDGIEEVEADGKKIRRGLGDTLSRDAVRQLQETTFHGADVDPQMVRLATMNLTLRGLDHVRILRRDALTRSLDRATKAELGLPASGFDVILANPPFSGRLDKDRIVEDVKVGKTAQTELLFLQYMLNQLKEGGRCGVVVPEGVLFGSTSAHRELRRRLIDNNTVEAVLSLPGGVFNPYSGVKTSVLVFRKGGQTQQVMFLHADNDGFKLDANHDQPVDEDDLPVLIGAFKDRDAKFDEWCRHDADSDWTEKWWFADANAIREADLNLSANRHRPGSREKVEHRDPLEILKELQGIEKEILEEIDELAKAVRDEAMVE